MKSSVLWFYRLVVGCLPESRCHGFKTMLLRLAGAKVGRNVRIYSSASILGNGELEIDDDVHIGSQVLIYSVAPAKISIGSHVDIAPRVMIITGGHQIDTEGMHIGGAGLSQSVAVGDGCWLCAGALILPGVTIPQKVVVAAGAVVTQSFSEGKSLWAGMPAQVKKSFCGDISSKEG